MISLLLLLITYECSLILIFFCLALLAVQVIALYMIFKKCGINGWYALIPLYNRYIFLTKICKLHPAYSILSIAIVVLSTQNTMADVANMIIYGFGFYNFAIMTHENNVPLIGILGGVLSSLMEIYYGLIKNFEYDPFVEVSENGPIGGNYR